MELDNPSFQLSKNINECSEKDNQFIVSDKELKSPLHPSADQSEQMNATKKGKENIESIAMTETLKSAIEKSSDYSEKNAHDSEIITKCSEDVLHEDDPISGSTQMNDDLLNNDEKEEVFLNGEDGNDDAECGKSESKPCKTIKRAVEKCIQKKSIILCTTEESNKYDAEPITFEDRNVEIKSNDNFFITIITALDESKVQQGDALLNIKQNGRLTLEKAYVHVNSSRESGRNQGLTLVEGDNATFKASHTHVTITDYEKGLNCVLFECKLGSLHFFETEISHFRSSFAFILAEVSNAVIFYSSMLNGLTTTSATQSVITIMSGCKCLTVYRSNFSDCSSTEHKLGGVLYWEIGSCNDSHDISISNFCNCSCKGKEANGYQNEESKGGAMYIRGNDGVVDALNLSLESVAFSDCSADKGEYIFLSLASGREQIPEDKLSFDMEEIYGKPNFILLEERKDGIGNIIDLMNDGTKRLPYSAQNIYVGGETSSQEKTCGRKEEP
ncbi:uncharacterized protein MONOS_13779 [Monocercomonoides exilis]|uniref:uncharacterized protein n=1 Tax=Monocercomonoides exilis TaxID=2049356 RepID=UPI003559B1D5|nr:hypothetical protein MONOS_13779 [Monocercomonoides exilis]|eukprot:MONOS_13779.1-p1 / transcript=MONOS_13779.1 / gene=MONOS_13779 / organism=Monocercomonoides_exilis_PA203 / gene_product=unspecified product / transcript_product=unspecified product / location=Mono_scaffold00882:6413-7915(+) / protein_length=501 / sequence_SO=supercontig / SO=protein_coding / is_pseudo=false